jgi:hypothetical protein
MWRLVIYGVLLCAAITMFACSEKSTKPTTESLIYQDGRCRQGDTRAGYIDDSCFSSEFAQNLLIDFCVLANCCPDTNRFALGSLIKGDTIVLTAVDTAANLCKCECPYRIHAEFQSLPLSRYLVLCSYNGVIVYRDTVVKTP